VQRKRLLFSAGTDGAVFAWKIEKIFSNEYQEAALAAQAHKNKTKSRRDANKGEEKKELEYKSFTCENTPWFLGTTASCIVDLPNIE